MFGEGRESYVEKEALWEGIERRVCVVRVVAGGGGIQEYVLY